MSKAPGSGPTPPASRFGLAAALVAGSSQLPCASRRGFRFGLAMLSAYGVQWVLIALTGAPAPLWLLAIALPLQVVLVAAAVHELAGGRGPARRRTLPGFVVVFVAWWLVAWQGSLALIEALPGNPLLLILLVPWELFLWLFVTPVLLLLPAAARTGASPLRQAIRTWRDLGAGRPVLFSIVALVLLSLWGWVQVAVVQVASFLSPFPAMASFLVGAVGVLGWATVAGATIPIVTGGGTAVTEPEPEPTSRPPYAWLAGAGLAGVVLVMFSAGLPLAVLMTDGTSALRDSLGAGIDREPMAALRHGSEAIGDAYMVQAVAAAITGRASDRDAASAQALWWAPQSLSVRRGAAWLAVVSGGDTAVRPAVLSLDSAGDVAGAAQATGIWLHRHHGDGRPWLFQALELDPLVSASMPDSVPSPPPGGLSSQVSAANLLIGDQQIAFADDVGWLIDAHAYVAAVALDDGLRRLMETTPGPSHLHPAWEESFAAMFAHLTAGDSQGAQDILGTMFDTDSDLARRQEVAAVVLNIASLNGNPTPSDFNAVVSFVQAQGSDRDRLNLAVYWVSVSDPVDATTDLEDLLHHSLSTDVRAEVLAVLATAEYNQAHFQAAVDRARQSLALHVDAVTPVAEATLGNALLALKYPNAGPDAEKDILDAAQRDPHAFILWYTLGRLEEAQGHPRQALDYQLKALGELSALNASGLGRFEVVISVPANAGHSYAFTDQTGYYAITGSISSDVAALQRQVGSS